MFARVSSSALAAGWEPADGLLKSCTPAAGPRKVSLHRSARPHYPARSCRSTACLRAPSRAALAASPLAPWAAVPGPAAGGGRGGASAGTAPSPTAAKPLLLLSSSSFSGIFSLTRCFLPLPPRSPASSAPAPLQLSYPFCSSFWLPRHSSTPQLFRKSSSASLPCFTIVLFLHSSLLVLACRWPHRSIGFWNVPEPRVRTPRGPGGGGGENI